MILLMVTQRQRLPAPNQLSEAKATLDVVAALAIKLGEGALGCCFHSRSSTERSIPITTRWSMCR